MAAVAVLVHSCLALVGTTPEPMRHVRPAMPRAAPVPALQLGLEAGGDLTQVLFGPLARKAEQAAKAESAWKVCAKAFTARGKADLDAMRAFMTLLGMGDEMDKLQRTFGVDAGNSTDSSAEMLTNMGEVIKAGLTAGIETRFERRQCLALSVFLGVLLVELAQLALVTPLAWIVGAGVSTGPGGWTPLRCALAVALVSREVIRPLRLGLQLWAANKLRRELSFVPPRRRVESASRCAAIAVAAVCLCALVLTQVDKLVFSDIARPRLSQISSAFGVPGPPEMPQPPLVLLASAIHTGFEEPAELTCAFLRSRVDDVTRLIGAMAEAARRIKPLNALLDLAETDAWLGQLSRSLLATLGCRWRIIWG